MPTTESPWYLAPGQHAQTLLEQSRTAEAAELFAAMLPRFGAEVSYGRALILERLGRSLHLSGKSGEAVTRLREAAGVIGRMTQTESVRRLRATVQSELGDALQALGRTREARQAYATAVKLSHEIGDRRAEAVDLAHLAAIAQAEGRTGEAVERAEAALACFRELGDAVGEAVIRRRLGRIHLDRRDWRAADRETREALALVQRYEPAGAEAWSLYGQLAEVAEGAAADTEDPDVRAALELRARGCRELAARGPRIAESLERLPDEPGEGRAALLGRLGRCWLLGGRPDLALEPLGRAVRMAAELGHVASAGGLLTELHLDLGAALRAMEYSDDARESYEAALRCAERTGDLRGAAAARDRLAALAEQLDVEQVAAGAPAEEPAVASAEAAGDGAVVLTVEEEIATDYVFATDLLVDGPRERRVTRRAVGTDDPPPADARLRLVPGTRAWPDGDGEARVAPAPGEPAIERRPDCTVMRRTARELVVTRRPDILWRLVAAIDGDRTAAEVLSRFGPDDRPVAAELLAALAALGAVDASGRGIARFVHSVTKKGVLPGGGLEGEEVLRLATDGGYREHPDAPRVPVADAVPDEVRPLHELTRRRRSRRDFAARPLARDRFDAILHTACGVTGTLPWSGRELRLRAYPSSGALYAVEIYPVVFRIEGLEPAVYHWRPTERVLEVVRPNLDPTRFVDAALPVERRMLGGAAALFCLTGVFPRHERKYGEGGYRMLVAEAGHISQNLTLAATALGVSARPFGGMFDELVNAELGLEVAEEQFLLGVLVGLVE